jgi:hypothetical protein
VRTSEINERRKREINTNKRTYVQVKATEGSETLTLRAASDRLLLVEDRTFRKRIKLELS